MSELEVLNLNTARKERQDALAARSAARAKPLIITIGEARLGPLPVEMPLNWLEPLMDVNVDLALIFQEVLEAAKKAGADQTLEMLNLITQQIVVNPNLPRQLLDALKQVGINMFGQAGWEALQEQNPSVPDYIALGSGLMRRYGSLGEALQSGESSPDGGPTSSSTSGPTASSTPSESGETPTILTSSPSEPPASISAV